MPTRRCVPQLLHPLLFALFDAGNERGRQLMRPLAFSLFTNGDDAANHSGGLSLKLLDRLGLIEIEPGPRLVNIFRFSNRWRTIDEVEAVMLAARAREVKPHRTFEKRREPKAVKRSTPKPMTVERPRVM